MSDASSKPWPDVYEQVLRELSAGCDRNARELERERAYQQYCREQFEARLAKLAKSDTVSP